MSTDTQELPADDRVSLTEAIYNAIEANADEKGHAPLGDVVDAARREVPQTSEEIHDRLELLQRHGEIYPVGNKVAITGGGS